jgi:hypothetical protein
VRDNDVQRSAYQYQYQSDETSNNGRESFFSRDKPALTPDNESRNEEALWRCRVVVGIEPSTRLIIDGPSQRSSRRAVDRHCSSLGRRFLVPAPSVPATSKSTPVAPGNTHRPDRRRGDRMRENNGRTGWLCRCRASLFLGRKGGTGAVTFTRRCQSVCEPDSCRTGHT